MSFRITAAFMTGATASRSMNVFGSSSGSLRHATRSANLPTSSVPVSSSTRRISLFVRVAATPLVTQSLRKSAPRRNVTRAADQTHLGSPFLTAGFLVMSATQAPPRAGTAGCCTAVHKAGQGRLARPSQPSPRDASARARLVAAVLSTHVDTGRRPAECLKPAMTAP